MPALRWHRFECAQQSGEGHRPDSAQSGSSDRRTRIRPQQRCPGTRRKTTDTVGLILIDIGNSLFVDIARGAESAASQAQLKLLLANSDSTRSKQDNYLELFDQARVAGVLLTPLEEPLDIAHSVLGHGRPVVLVIASSADPLMCSVMVNEELGGYLAASHLLQAGAHRLVFLAGFPELRLIRRRLAGVREPLPKLAPPSA